MRLSFRSREGDILADSLLRVAAGEFTRISSVYKFGFADAIGTTEGTVWGQSSLYAHPASAEAMTISSSSAADTSAGTGARTVEVFALDSDHVEQAATFSLNGQTGVAIGTRLRVNRAIVKTAGSGAENAGTLYIGSGTVTAGVPANIYATVEPGKNQTLMAVWTVPADKTAYLSRITASTGGNANTIVTARLVARPDGGVFNTKDLVLLTRDGGILAYEHKVPVAFPEKTDLELRATASVGTIDVSGTMEFILLE